MQCFVEVGPQTKAFHIEEARRACTTFATTATQGEAVFHWGLKYTGFG